MKSQHKWVIFIVVMIWIPIIVYLVYPKGPIKIGFLSALTGRYSQLGIFARDGVNLLVQKTNDEGGINGRKIKLYIEDNQGAPVTNQVAIKNLLNKDVRLIIGPLTSNMAESTIEALKGKSALVISPTISLDKVKDLDDNFIRINNSASQQGKDISEHVLRLGMKKASVIIDFPNEAYTIPVYEAFRDNYEKAGGVVKMFRKINIKEKLSFLKLAHEIDQQGTDMLLMITSGMDTATISQQVRKLNKKIQFVSSMWAKTNELIIHGGKAVEGTILVGKYETGAMAEKKATFNRAFQNQYKSKPSFISALAYEATTVLFQVIKEAKTDDPLLLKKKILEIGRFDGLEEDIIINQFGDAIRKNSLFIVKNGSFDLIIN